MYNIRASLTLSDLLYFHRTYYLRLDWLLRRLLFNVLFNKVSSFPLKQISGGALKNYILDQIKYLSILNVFTSLHRQVLSYLFYPREGCFTGSTLWTCSPPLYLHRVSTVSALFLIINIDGSSGLCLRRVGATLKTECVCASSLACWADVQLRCVTMASRWGWSSYKRAVSATTMRRLMRLVNH